MKLATSAHALSGILMAMFLVLSGSGTVLAEPPAVPEYNVKAAFLLNILKYASWPRSSFAEPTSPFVIGILGDDPFGATLDRLAAARRIDERRVAVRRSRRAADLRGSHLVFISPSESAHAAALCALFAEGGALSVADSTATEGVVAINFGVRDGHVRFSVNLDVAQAANVSVSSKLLHLASSVKGAVRAGKEQP